MSTQLSDTSRTEAQILRYRQTQINPPEEVRFEGHSIVSADFARQLERELSAYKAAVESTHQRIDDSGVMPTVAVSHAGLPARVDVLIKALAAEKARADAENVRAQHRARQLCAMTAERDALAAQVATLEEEIVTFNGYADMHMREKARREALEAQVATYEQQYVPQNELAAAIADRDLWHKQAQQLAKDNVALCDQIDALTERVDCLTRDKDQLGEERRAEWIRAENAEAQMTTLREVFKTMVIRLCHLRGGLGDEMDDALLLQADAALAATEGKS